MSGDVQATVTLSPDLADWLRRTLAYPDLITDVSTEVTKILVQLACSLPPPEMDEPTVIGAVVSTDRGLAILARPSAGYPWWRVESGVWGSWASLGNPRPATADDIQRWS